MDTDRIAYEAMSPIDAVARDLEGSLAKLDELGLTHSAALVSRAIDMIRTGRAKRA